jgi:RNA polymerase sigma-70 factor, ECF subfamily
MSDDLPTGEATRAAEVFNEHRGLLVAVAYRVLGRHADAEDVVQDAWLRWSGAETASVDDPKAYLVTVTTRLAIDQLRKAQTRKESYVGPWLPEPLVTDPRDASEKAVLDDTVSMAMLLVMETLSPLERAVFVLREAFDYGYGEIAAMLDKSEPAVRQLVTRARAHVQERRPRFPADETARRRVSENFLAACTGGSVERLMALLAPGVVVTSDGGGVVSAARRPVLGAENVARFFVGYIGKAGKLIAEGQDVRLAVAASGVNGCPAVAILLDSAPVYLYILDLDENGLVREVFTVANPAKMTGVAQLTFIDVTDPEATAS